ncbi:toprim domain-containing protein [Anaerobacillus isosaccharinicus]|uniref:DUF2399 domain-containing protein n=1 Tax=Anaerobacillus isosaccharinicus TaxID=1532552 RepID=A0A1S2M4D5_9BACI|nr:toprim domain-containing protein [Anaerobacillus isosaccharinicus]MBA5586404.1 DUF2399 domain-containing protein [Anaerobacillus isosaccharinicus]QOY35351.1 DUF2399 domain-containing protein [Anaerobacillus isosaccharinicus]
MNSESLNFIKKYLLKKGEELGSEQKYSENEITIDIPIIKCLETKIKMVGLMTCSASHNTDLPEIIDKEVMQLASISPTKKFAMNDLEEAVALRLVTEGWLIKEIRFNKDGRTVNTVHYRTGYRLNFLQQKISEENERSLDEQLKVWKESIILTERITFHNKALSNLLEYIRLIYKQEGIELLNNSHIPQNWTVKKKLKFLHFLSAILYIRSNKEEFDWKEIGARYYQKIGGSKEFDSYKDDFIDQLEEIIQLPISVLGLVSLGKVTPLYFSGPIQGSFSNYNFGPVHALTDLSIAQDQYSSSAKTLWLVENRAVLTRVTSVVSFLKELNTLLVCVDGHVRSSHRQCLKQLIKNSQLHQVIIWTDYDKDGFLIAKQLYNIVNAEGIIKFIDVDGKVVKSWDEYEQRMKKLLAMSKNLEQEQLLGSVESWKNWILQ